MEYVTDNYERSSSNIKNYLKNIPKLHLDFSKLFITSSSNHPDFSISTSGTTLTSKRTQDKTYLKHIQESTKKRSVFNINNINNSKSRNNANDPYRLNQRTSREYDSFIKNYKNKNTSIDSIRNDKKLSLTTNRTEEKFFNVMLINKTNNPELFLKKNNQKNKKPKINLTFNYLKERYEKNKLFNEVKKDPQKVDSVFYKLINNKTQIDELNKKDKKIKKVENLSKNKDDFENFKLQLVKRNKILIEQLKKIKNI